MSSNMSVMKVPLEALRGPRLKAERAHKHIDDILAASNAVPADWFDFSLKARTVPPHAKPTRFELTYTPLKPIPELFALMIGDAVHNLRAALDHLATQIARSVDRDAMIHFPVTKHRKDLHHRGHLAKMEAALPGSEDLLSNKIRPVDGAQDHLWSFGGIDNDDKHNLIIPTVTLANISGLNWNMGGSIFRDCGAGNDAAKPFVAVSAGSPFALQGEPKASVKVSFGPGAPFEGEPVVPTLSDVANLVTEVLDRFEVLIRKQLTC